MQKVAVVCASGIGDGLLSLVLSHNAILADCTVDTYSTPLLELKDWFPLQKIFPFPKIDDLEKTFNSYDIILAADHSILSQLLTHDSRFHILKEKSFDKSKTIVENLMNVSKKVFQIKHPEQSNGITPPLSLNFRSHKKRIILHPEATEAKRKWSKGKFIKLAKTLAKKGWDPAICLSPAEKENWIDLPSFVSTPQTERLSDVAALIYESHSLIGNNSGLGHLASCLKIPTISLFARKTYATLWRPGFGNNTIITPLPFLIGAGLKHKYWQYFLFPSQVTRIYEKTDA